MENTIPTDSKSDLIKIDKDLDKQVTIPTENLNENNSMSVTSNTSSSSETVFVDSDKIREIKNLKNLDEFLDFIIKYENEKVDKLLEYIFDEINPFKTHQISKKKQKKILLHHQNQISDKVDFQTQIEKTSSDYNKNLVDIPQTEKNENSKSLTSQEPQINSKPAYTIFSKLYEFFPRPLTDEERVINPPSDIQRKKFKFYLTKFCLDFFLTLDNKEKIFQKVLKNLKVTKNIISVISLMRKYKNKKNLIISYDKRIKNQAIDSLTKINYQYIKEFMEIFDLKEIFYQTAPLGSTHLKNNSSPNKKNSKNINVPNSSQTNTNFSLPNQNQQCNPPIIINVINDQIYNLQENKGVEKIVKFIEFCLKYNNEEKIIPSEEFKALMDINSLIDICLSEKALFGVVKKILRIFPEKIEGLVNYYLKKNDTKQASDLAKDKEFMNYISKETVDCIISKAYIKCACYHYNRYYSYEIDIEQLVEMFQDKPETLSFLANKFCKENLLQESYYIYKAVDFNTNLIKLDPHLEKLFKGYLISTFEENSKIYSIYSSNNSSGSSATKGVGNKNKNKKFSSFTSTAESIYGSEQGGKGVQKNKTQNSKNNIQSINNQNDFYAGVVQGPPMPKITDSLTSDFLKIFLHDENINLKHLDFFGPITEQAMRLDLDYGHVHFVDCLDSLEKLSSFLIAEGSSNNGTGSNKNKNKSPSSYKNNSNNSSTISSLSVSELVGIDFEWRSKTCPLEKDEGVAIMQISTKEKVFIFDVFKLNAQPEFLSKFVEIFKHKTFLGFGFKNDISMLTNQIKTFFVDCKFLDIPEIYKKKFNTPCPNLSEVCKKFLNKELCKGEQISNWERRPLRKRQMHYAALDAYVLLKIYEKLNNSD